MTFSYILLLQTFNMVVEIPRFSQAKFEINRERPLNPIRQDQIEDFNTTTFSLRSLINVFPFVKIEYFILFLSLQCHTVMFSPTPLPNVFAYLFVCLSDIYYSVCLLTLTQQHPLQ